MRDVTVPINLAFRQGGTLRNLPDGGFSSFETANLVPAREGYIFIGWFLPDGRELDVGTIIYESITITAKWEAQIAFDDVNPWDWFHEAVMTVATHGLFHGTAYRQFEPQITMSRAMFTQVLANLAGVDMMPMLWTHSAFGDVVPGMWYNATVNWAASMGFDPGVGDGNFEPNIPITRESMAMMLYNYSRVMNVQLPEFAVEPFTDQWSVSPWATEAIRVIQAAGIIRGRPDGSFDPQASATRAEVAAIFAMFLRIAQ